MMSVSLLQQSLALLLLASASTTTSAAPSTHALRALEENGYQYMDSLSGYQMQFGKCIRVKVPKDDDDEEGNSYFYNGHYYAQGQQFASVYLCDNGDNCGTCDTSKEYVTDLATYLESALGYAQAMCQSCSAQCYNRRRLEDAEDAYMNVDCNQCHDTCKNMNFAYADQDGEGDEEDGNDDNNANDETMYLECQAAFQDEDGNAIYVGPQCDENNDITIGFYYDEDCTVKSSSQEMDYGFEYGTFHGVQSMCLECDPYGNGGDDDVCQDLYQGSTHCSSGKDLNNGGDDGDLPICRTLAKSHKEHVYGTHQRKWRVVETLVAVVLIGGLCLSCLTLSYTYFLRHRRPASNKEPLVDGQDYHTAPEVTINNKEGVVA